MISNICLPQSYDERFYSTGAVKNWRSEGGGDVFTHTSKLWAIITIFFNTMSSLYECVFVKDYSEKLKSINNFQVFSSAQNITLQKCLQKYF